MDITLLKLGGSLITDKSTPYTAKPQIIKNILLEVKDALEEKPDLNLIIGHGAGSFAHQSAKKYNTINGFKNEKEKYYQDDQTGAHEVPRPVLPDHFADDVVDYKS